MKIGSAVLGLHIAAIIAFALTQGCITTESKGSGRGAGAKHKGPFKHEHKGKTSTPAVADDSIYPTDGQSTYDPVIIDSETQSSMPEPYVVPEPSYGNTEPYIVQKGDVLSRLAVDFNTTTQTLMAMNGLSNPDVIYVGQELRVPAGSKRRSSSTTSKPSVKKGGTYLIQSGDTLSGIALAAGVNIDDLRSLNNIQDDKIFAGETLDIPSGGKVPVDTQKSTPKKDDPVAPEPTPPAESAEVESADSSMQQLEAVTDHVVYPGETLDDISRQYSVGKSDIMRMNSISSESDIKEGQRLRIPITE